MSIKNSKLIQVTYVLTSNGKDIYADMNLISLRSLRYTNPHTKIILVCDLDTVQSLKTSNHYVSKEVDRIIAVKTPDQPPSFRNRFIKTSLRQYLSGDFLYLDADTIVRGDISEIFLNKASLAGVPNHNGIGSHLEMPGRETIIFEQLNWSFPSHYVNGGVLFFSENSETYLFCDLWHQKWLECSTKTGKHFDQPSLNSAIEDSKIKFCWLDHHFNAQVHARPHTAWNAKVWHIYLSEPHPLPKNVFTEVLEQLKTSQNLSAIQIAKICERKQPWLIHNLLDCVAVYSLKNSYQKLSGQSWQRLWLADQYKLADCLKNTWKVIITSISKLFWKNLWNFTQRLGLLKRKILKLFINSTEKQ